MEQILYDCIKSTCSTKNFLKNRKILVSVARSASRRISHAWTYSFTFPLLLSCDEEKYNRSSAGRQKRYVQWRTRKEGINLRTRLGLKINPRWLTGCPGSRNQFTAPGILYRADHRSESAKRNSLAEISRITLTSLFIPGQFFQADDLSPACTPTLRGVIAGAVYETWFIFNRVDLIYAIRERKQPRGLATYHATIKTTANTGDLCRSTCLLPLLPFYFHRQVLNTEHSIQTRGTSFSRYSSSHPRVICFI